MANKVYKKSSADEKIVLYLEKRTLYDSTTCCDPICGLVVVNEDSVKDQQVFVQLVVTYQYGRGDCDDVMGIKFSREFLLCHQLVFPVKQQKLQPTTMQRKLMAKFGGKAHLFQLTFPVNSPNSVILRDLDQKEGNELGVSYAVQAYVGDDVDDNPKESDTLIDMAIFKLQHASNIKVTRLPMAWISKGMAFGQGKIDLEVTLEREYFYHGEQVPVSIVIINESSKTIKYVKCVVMQHTEVTMIDTKIDKQVASLETRDGFPIEAGDCMTKYIYLVPSVDNNSDRFGLALDGHMKDETPHLASSTMATEGHFIESIGIVISYSVTVELDCGTFGGKLTTEVPFKLVNPCPESPYCQQQYLSKRRRSSSSLIKDELPDKPANLMFRGFRRVSINNLE